MLYNKNEILRGIDNKALKKALSVCLYHTEESRAHLSSILWEIKGGQLTLYASNGFEVISYYVPTSYVSKENQIFMLDNGLTRMIALGLRYNFLYSISTIDGVVDGLDIFFNSGQTYHIKAIKVTGNFPLHLTKLMINPVIGDKWDNNLVITKTIKEITLNFETFYDSIMRLEYPKINSYDSNDVLGVKKGIVFAVGTLPDPNKKDDVVEGFDVEKYDPSKNVKYVQFENLIILNSSLLVPTLKRLKSIKVRGSLIIKIVNNSFFVINSNIYQYAIMGYHPGNGLLLYNRY